jgi:sec-independent protein translocase protein TatB
MFDVGIWEIGVIGAVALVVLGPERLPKVARTAGHLFGRLQRYVNTVKADINREMEASEFANLKREVQDAAKSFEQTVNQTANTVEAEARALEKAADPLVTETPKVAVEATPAVTVQHVADANAPQAVAARPTPMAEFGVVQSAPARAETNGNFSQGAFDFGIEPSRKAKRS